MTHDRGGSAVIGTGAAVILIADLLYATSRWTGSFPRAFLLALGTLAAVAAIAFALRFIRPIGAGRESARWNQRGVNIVLLGVIFAFLDVNHHFGGNEVGEILGTVAGASGGFALYTAVWIARKRS
jgi:hypothetical protein